MPQSEDDMEQADFSPEREKIEMAQPISKPDRCNGSSSAPEQWKAAMAWVMSNKALIRQIASPYLRHMAAEASDLNQEAILAAFCAMRETRRKGSPDDQFIPFFRVIFKTNCIRLASGINTTDCPEIDTIAAPERLEQPETEITQEIIMKTMQRMTRRQRQVCCWLLEQKEPVSTPELARKFKISRRHACRLISGSIARLTAVAPA